MMPKDPIIEELRELTAKLLEQCGGDIKRFAQHLREGQAHHAHRVVRRNTTLRPPGVSNPQEGHEN